MEKDLSRASIFWHLAQCNWKRLEEDVGEAEMHRHVLNLYHAPPTLQQESAPVMSIILRKVYSEFDTLVKHSESESSNDCSLMYLD